MSANKHFYPQRFFRFHRLFLHNDTILLARLAILAIFFHSEQRAVASQRHRRLSHPPSSSRGSEQPANAPRRRTPQVSDLRPTRSRCIPNRACGRANHGVSGESCRGTEFRSSGRRMRTFSARRPRRLFAFVPRRTTRFVRTSSPRPSLLCFNRRVCNKQSLFRAPKRGG